MRLEKGYVPMFGAGHCSWNFGKYEPLAKGKQYTHPHHRTIYEGNYNRMIVQKIMWRLYKKNVPYGEIHIGAEDMPLRERSDKANALHKLHPKTYYTSFHGNAGKGKGIEGWTSEGHTLSDVILDFVLSKIEDKFSVVTKMRFDYSNGDRGKEKNYAILRWTNCPAFILELGFMDTLADYEWMMNDSTTDMLADIIAAAMEDIYFNGIN